MFYKIYDKVKIKPQEEGVCSSLKKVNLSTFKLLKM